MWLSPARSGWTTPAGASWKPGQASSLQALGYNSSVREAKIILKRGWVLGRIASDSSQLVLIWASVSTLQFIEICLLQNRKYFTNSEVDDLWEVPCLQETVLTVDEERVLNTVDVIFREGSQTLCCSVKCIVEPAPVAGNWIPLWTPAFEQERSLHSMFLFKYEQQRTEQESVNRKLCLLHHAAHTLSVSF